MAKKSKDIKFADSAPKHAKKTKKRVMDKKLMIGLGILCGVTGILEITCVILLAMTNMLPMTIIGLVGLAMALLLAIICILMFSKSKNRFGKRKIAATVLAAITIICCIIGIYFMSSLFGALDDVFKGNKISKDELDDPFIVYISGSDTRNNELDEVSRSDVNILAVVNPTTHQVLLLNTPRDYYIPNPALNNQNDKLTHCGTAGIENSMAALASLYGLDEIDYYGRINFTGFTTLIDAIGGVDVYSDIAFTASESGFRIQSGENHLNGTDALAFARERHALANGDIGRGENQMKVIKAVISKVTSSDTLIRNYSDIMKSLTGMFETDVPQLLMTNTVKQQLSDNPNWNVQSYTVSGNTGWAVCASSPNQQLSVVFKDEEMVNTAKDLIEKVLNGETVDTTTLSK